MRQNVIFVVTLWGALGLAYLYSGERFLNLLFDMPNLGSLDEAILNAAFGAEEFKESIGATDLFGRLRDSLHKIAGL
jgi:hypothetical protein